MGCCNSTYDRLQEPEPRPEPKFDKGASSWNLALYRAKDLSDEQIDYWASRRMRVLHQMFERFEEIERKPTPCMIELACSRKYWSTFNTCMIQQSMYGREIERCCRMIRVLVTYNHDAANDLLHRAVKELQDIKTIKFILQNPYLKDIDEEILAYAKFSSRDKRISQLLEKWKAQHDNASAGSSKYT